MVADERVKRAVISGASHALGYKSRNPRLTDEEIIQRISDETNIIIRKLGSSSPDSKI